MSELEAASVAGNLEEVFGTGTAAIVSPIGSIRWEGRLISCGMSSLQEGVATKMRQWIEARQYGEDEHEWSVLVDSAYLAKSPEAKL
jgi:branched-chain amino acid aminotransferase